MNRDERRRLEKAVKDKNPNKLIEWSLQYENQVKEELRREYEKTYREEINDSVNNFLIAVLYTLHFSEETTIKNENIPEFMCDLYSTVDMFRTGEYKPEEYEEILNRDGVFLDKFDYCKLYKEKLEKLDKLRDEYIDKLNNLKFEE